MFNECALQPSQNNSPCYPGSLVASVAIPTVAVAAVVIAASAVVTGAVIVRPPIDHGRLNDDGGSRTYRRGVYGRWARCRITDYRRRACNWRRSINTRM